jgi:fatty-acyl-CoA synthase
VAGSSDDPLKFMTIPQFLDRACARNGAGDAAVFANGLRLSWYDLRRRSDDVAAGLLALGVKRGDRVGIWAPNRAEWLYAQFGTARIGAILVNINPAYQRSELEYALNKVQCKVLIMARALKSSDYLAMVRALAPEIETARRACGPSACRVCATSSCSTTGRCRPAQCGSRISSRPRARPSRAPRRTVRRARSGRCHQYPVHLRHHRLAQGATLTPFNIVNNARSCAKAMALGASDRLCIPVPLYHCFGMVLGVLAARRRRRHGVSGRGFEPRATLRRAHEHCTALHGVPTMFIASSITRTSPVRSLEPAHRHHGGRALPDRGDARGDRADAHERGDDRVRHDRDRAGLVPERLDDPLERRVTTVGASSRTSRSRSSTRRTVVPLGETRASCAPAAIR